MPSARPRRYPHFTPQQLRTRLRMGQPDRLFDFMVWHLWFWGFSPLLFVIGLLPRDTRRVVLVLTLLKDIGRVIAGSIEKTRENTDWKTLRTASFWVALWIGEVGLVWGLGEWSQMSFVVPVSAKSVLLTGVVVTILGTIMESALKIMERHPRAVQDISGILCLGAVQLSIARWVNSWSRRM
ncbi:MAG: hypothetical protein M1820_004392 [Bogoriella megaspora]|nr:MAG: hypothetical protein M1820_004392 [Bogoriella megaspora]